MPLPQIIFANAKYGNYKLKRTSDERELYWFKSDELCGEEEKQAKINQVNKKKNVELDEDDTKAKPFRVAILRTSSNCLFRFCITSLTPTFFFPFSSICFLPTHIHRLRLKLPLYRRRSIQRWWTSRKSRPHKYGHLREVPTTTAARKKARKRKEKMEAALWRVPSLNYMW